MNKSQFKSLILEVQAEMAENKEQSIKDELGSFWIITKPKSQRSTRDDIMFECTLVSFINQIKGGLTKEEILGVFKVKSDANRFATETLKEYGARLKEVEDQMAEFRKTKADLDAKKEAAKEKIIKLKS
mgnify:CR=1 FL=1